MRIHHILNRLDADQWDSSDPPLVLEGAREPARGRDAELECALCWLAQGNARERRAAARFLKIREQLRALRPPTPASSTLPVPMAGAISPYRPGLIVNEDRAPIPQSSRLNHWPYGPVISHERTS